MILKFRLALMAGAMTATMLAPFVWAAQNFALDSTRGLQPYDVRVEATSYHGRKAVLVIPTTASDATWAATKTGEGGGIAVLPGTTFHNGTIEMEVAGKPRADAPADARGFVGVAFRVNADVTKYECFYIRPTNGRADDQLRRNHSAQYMSFPDYLWLKLRNETPGQYESYVDLVPGEWTKIKIEVTGTKARLYVNGASQPTLVVNDLKLGDGKGDIALWVGVGTDAYFTNLRISE